MKLNIVKLQRFSTHDGPGIRTVVFTKGCPLSCRWCHNPETQSPSNQIFYTSLSCISCGECVLACKSSSHIIDGQGNHIFDPSRCNGCLKCTDVCPSGALERVGKEEETAQILKEVLKDKAFYGSDGGITLSGGEPMMQADASIELLSMAKQHGITTAVETCGYFNSAYIKRLAEVTDTFLWDFKDGVSERHYAYTGVGNEQIIKNLLETDRFAKHIILRCIMVNGVNTDDDNISKIISVYHSLTNCDGVEIIPYHAYGGSKCVQMGYEDNGNVSWIPSEDTLSKIRMSLKNAGCNVLG